MEEMCKETNKEMWEWRKREEVTREERGRGRGREKGGVQVRGWKKSEKVWVGYEKKEREKKEKEKEKKEIEEGKEEEEK